MKIELIDMDMPYELGIDTNAEGEDFLRIKPNVAIENRVDDYDLCLDHDNIVELIKTLQFMLDFIKD